MALHVPSHSSVFVYLHSGNIASISKECFVSLLEHAEEKLHSKAAYIFFPQSVPPDTRRHILRDFRFLGFEMLPPSHPLVCSSSSLYHFMAYELEGESESED